VTGSFRDSPDVQQAALIAAVHLMGDVTLHIAKLPFSSRQGSRLCTSGSFGSTELNGELVSAEEFERQRSPLLRPNR
jgi:hypothetical protein